MPGAILPTARYELGESFSSKSESAQTGNYRNLLENPKLLYVFGVFVVAGLILHLQRAQR